MILLSGGIYWDGGAGNFDGQAKDSADFADDGWDVGGVDELGALGSEVWDATWGCDAYSAGSAGATSQSDGQRGDVAELVCAGDEGCAADALDGSLKLDLLLHCGGLEACELLADFETFFDASAIKHFWAAADDPDAVLKADLDVVCFCDGFEGDEGACAHGEGD